MLAFNEQRMRRLKGGGLPLPGVAVAAWLAANAFREHLLFYFSPSELAAGQAPVDPRVRMGGLVVSGSVAQAAGGVTVHFPLTDLARTVRVTVRGILPDLFSDDQGIVAHGNLDEPGTFRAREVLAKHAEQHMPPEVAEALKARGEPPLNEVGR